jgi:GntR family transcriptional regulator
VNNLCVLAEVVDFRAVAMIDKQSHIPYYYQLVEFLRQVIWQAPPVESRIPLPSEHELAKIHNISRATVRQALSVLEQEGLIYKEKGIGTFISKNRPRFELDSLIPTTDEMVRRGWRPGTQVISLKQIASSVPIREALQLAEGEQLYEICRLRLGNDEPVCLQWSYIPSKLCPDLLEQDLTQSLTHLLDDRYGILFWSANILLRARLATPLEEQYLKITVGSPVICLEQTTYLQSGQPVEFLQSVWRSDRYDFTFKAMRAIR